MERSIEHLYFCCKEKLYYFSCGIIRCEMGKKIAREIRALLCRLKSRSGMFLREGVSFDT